MKKLAGIYLFLFLLTTKSFCQEETIIIDKFNLVEMKISYEKPEGIEQIFMHTDVSVIVESICLNDECKNIAVQGSYLMGDTYYEAKRIPVNSERQLMTYSLPFEIKDRNNTGKRYLLLDSMATGSHVLYSIPEFTKQITVKYKVMFPLSELTTEYYTKTFNLEWQLPEKDFIQKIEVYTYGYNSGVFDYDDEILLKSIEIEKEDYQCVIKTLEEIYQTFPQDKKIIFQNSYNKMMNYVNRMTYLNKYESPEFKDGFSDNSPCFSLSIQ